MEHQCACVLLLLAYHRYTGMQLLQEQVCLEINVEELKHMFIPYKHSVEQNCNPKIPTEVWLCYSAWYKYHSPYPTNILSGQIIFQNLTSHFRILGIKRVKYSKFSTVQPAAWSLYLSHFPAPQKNIYVSIILWRCEIDLTYKGNNIAWQCCRIRCITVQHFFLHCIVHWYLFISDVM